MKIIGLSGAQGAGKSTLLKELILRGYEVDQFRVSRAVQAELGWSSLEQVMHAPKTMMQFQNKVLEQKYKNDLLLKSQVNERSIILTERTFADIMAYTMHWTKQFIAREEMSLLNGTDFLLQFSHKCESAHREIYDGVILLPYMDHVVWETDPNRASLSDVNTIYISIEKFIEMPQIANSRLRICGKSVQERADEVQAFLTTLAP